MQVYKYYDLVFWSQTSWKWVEAKITEMGILFSTEYRVTFILDRSSMPRVEDHHYYKRKRDSSKSEVKYYEIKPLQLIWDKVCGDSGVNDWLAKRWPQPPGKWCPQGPQCPHVYVRTHTHTHTHACAALIASVGAHLNMISAKCGDHFEV